MISPNEKLYFFYLKTQLSDKVLFNLQEYIDNAYLQEIAMIEYLAFKKSVIFDFPQFICLVPKGCKLQKINSSFRIEAKSD
jgi:hypothetical protein